MSVTTGQLGCEDCSGILMYVLYRNNIPNSIYSTASTVWQNVSHINKSPSGVAETDIEEYPDAEILQQTNIKRFPALLFVRVEGSQMTKILAKEYDDFSLNNLLRKYEYFLDHEVVVEGEVEASIGDNTPDGKFWLQGDSGFGLGWKLGIECDSFLPAKLCNWNGYLLGGMFVLVLVVSTILLMKLINK